MKKFMIALSVLALAAIVALPAYAEKSEKKAKDYTGTVSAIDAEKGTIVVDKKKESKTFTCNADTKIELGKKEAGKLADIKQGEKVKVKFAMKGETAVAEKIVVVTAEKKEKAAEKKEAK